MTYVLVSKKGGSFFLHPSKPRLSNTATMRVQHTGRFVAARKPLRHKGSSHFLEAQKIVRPMQLRGFTGLNFRGRGQLSKPTPVNSWRDT